MSVPYGQMRVIATLSAAGVGAADTTNGVAFGTFTANPSDSLPPPPFDFTGFNKIEVQLTSAAPTGTVTTPTSTVKLQGSMDNVNWFDCIAFTPTSTSANTEQKAYQAGPTSPWGRYYRLTADVATGSGTATYALTAIVLAQRA